MTATTDRSWLLAVADLVDPPPVDVFGLLGYVPSPEQAAFHDADEFDVGFGGMAGTNKSHALVLEGIRACVAYPGIRVGAFRRTYDELAESLLPKIWKYSESLARLFGARLTDPRNRPELAFANGSVMRFRAADSMEDATKRSGGEYQLILIDERQQLDPDIVHYIVNRIRSGSADVPAIGIRSTFNPGDIGHVELKERYIDRTNFGAETYEWRPSRPDGTPDMDAAPSGMWVRFIPGKRSEFLDAGYWARLEADPNPVRRRQLAFGDWDAGGGLVFSEVWRREVHVVEPWQMPFSIGAGHPKGIGIDWGRTRPFVALWGAKVRDDVVVVYREAYATNLTRTEQARLVLSSEGPDERMPGRSMPAWLDPSSFTAGRDERHVAGMAPTQSDAAIYTRAGLPVIPANNNRKVGLDLVFEMLKIRPEDNAPRLFIYSTCRNLIRTLPGLPWSKTHPEDVDTNAADDCYDALRYLLAGLFGKRSPMAIRQGAGNRPLTAGLQRQQF